VKAAVVLQSGRHDGQVAQLIVLAASTGCTPPAQTGSVELSGQGGHCGGIHLLQQELLVQSLQVAGATPAAQALAATEEQAIQVGGMHLGQLQAEVGSYGLSPTAHWTVGLTHVVVVQVGPVVPPVVD
jgi:hypothetical protein